MNAPKGRLWWLMAGIGWVFIVIGVAGALGDVRLTKPVNLTLWVLGSLIAHDFIAAPLTFGIGILITRVQGRRAAIQLGMFISAVILLIAIPLSIAGNKDPHNFSALPHPYLRNAMLMAGVILTVALVAYVAGRGRRRVR